MGMLDGFTTQAYVWDLISAAIIVEEAGGKVTDLEGNPINWDQERVDMVASNGLIHDQILEAIN